MSLYYDKVPGGWRCFFCHAFTWRNPPNHKSTCEVGRTIAFFDTVAHRHDKPRLPWWRRVFT